MFDSFSLEILHDTIRIYSFLPTFKKDIIGYVLPLLYEDSFFNITQCYDEISLFISKDIGMKIEGFPFITSTNEDFRVIKLYHDQHKINDTGIVSEISNYFSSLNIPILYVNSFNNNFVIVHSKDIDKLKDFIEY